VAIIPARIGGGMLKTALPRSAKFAFIADRRDKCRFGFLIAADQVPGECCPGSLKRGGINYTYFSIDPTRGNEHGRNVN
jgi:methyl acetate hydrolase